MNGYECFWRGKVRRVMAETSYQAQLEAAKLFGAKKSYEITVVLCDKAGEQIIHQPQHIGG